MTIIANSGIQFYHTKVNLSTETGAATTRFSYCEYVEKDASGNDIDVRFVIPYYWAAENVWIEKAPGVESDYSVNKEAIDVNTWKITDESRINKAFVKKIPEGKITQVRLSEALELFEGEWLPLPYFKIIDNCRFHSGPSSWARMWVNRISVAENQGGALTHNVTIAFDTNIFKDQPDYFTPDNTDAEAGSVFACATDDKNLTYFNSSQWVTEWLEKVFTKRSKKKSDLYFKYLALYFTMVKALENVQTFPTVSFHKGEFPVEVDLILDVGNARTCGIIVETSVPGAPFEFNRAMPITLMDLTNPDRRYSESFEMKLVFAKQTFGFESAGALAGHDNAFIWPSLVRVGPEATRLSIIHENLENIGMSSPKKYLWDKNKRLFQWNYVSEYGSGPVMFGIGKLFTQDGMLINGSRALKIKQANADNGKPPVIAALNAYYSRSSLMTFALIEIFLQTLSFLNSYEFRRRQGNERLPRKLKRIVLTCPVAMLETEKLTLRENAEDAVKALQDYFGKDFIDHKLEIIPNVDDLRLGAEYRTNWGYDEATCSQMSFLYGEIFVKFQNKHEVFFKTMGKKRLNNTNPEKPSVMVASVDIGGGTTDLMICNYESNPAAYTTVLRPDPQFWEGFNIAGDTIVKSIIERLVLPAIRVEMDKKGCNTNNCFPFLFGPYLGLLDANDRMRRKQFAYEIANCIAIEYLKHASFEKSTEQRTFDSFFIDNPSPNDKLVIYIGEKAAAYGAKGFNLKDVVFELNTQNINKVVKDVVEKMLHDLCLVISKYNCDYLLLAGRPTMLPIIKELFLKYLPVMPDRIVPLGNFKAGAWYPFANERGMIKDPKTCVAVGATVALMGGLLNRLGAFSIDSSLLKEKVESTANYIGKFEPQSQKVEEIYLSDTQYEVKIMFFGELLIGMKQISKADWIGTMMYKLAFADNTLAKEYNNRLPFTIILERSPTNKETLTIAGGITDKTDKPVNNNVLSLTMQTIADERGHWLDTGIFSV